MMSVYPIKRHGAYGGSHESNVSCEELSATKHNNDETEWQANESLNQPLESWIRLQ